MFADNVKYGVKNMIVTLITKKCINSITLPEKISGQYWLNLLGKDVSRPFINIEAMGDKWVLKSNKSVQVIDNDKKVKSVVLEPMSIYWIESENERYSVFTESVTDDRQTFVKYTVGEYAELSIGRNEDNDIIFANSFVSGYHAGLKIKDDKWYVFDNDSTNYLFVNGRRTAGGELKNGDVIYIMGFKIVVGNHFIAINNPDNQVNINTELLSKFKMQKTEYTVDDESEEYEPEYFYRSPRFKRNIEKASFRIDPPPQNAVGEEMPFVLVLGPSVTMGMAALATAYFAVNNAITNGNFISAMPSVVMSLSMMMGTVLWPVVTKKYEKRRRYKKEALRQSTYKKYLEGLANEISSESRKQEEILNENYITTRKCLERIKTTDRKLWERSPGQDDFLKLRVGTGKGILTADIVYPEKRFLLENDNLTDEMYRLCESKKELLNIPITLSFIDDWISGVIGDRINVIDFAKGLIVQLATYYSYDEVKMVFIYDDTEESVFDFVKWLPHVWSSDRKFRFVAKNENEAKEISSYLEKEIDLRSQLNDNELEGVAPYYVIFAISRKISVRSDMLKQIYAKKKNIKMSVITLFDRIENLPKECSMVVELDGLEGKLYDKDDLSGGITQFFPDISVVDDITDLSKRLANVRLDESDASSKLPSMITFLEMFGVGKTEHLNVLTRWKENDPAKSLETPVGVDTVGGNFKLDLHEKFHGPHGLVAGMTGSGKSEFIITYILSLAVNYHPEEVAFILIDYKGGGMAKSFKKLPHTAGIITNLDGAAIKRSLISIESELKRRQAIFSRVSEQIGISNIDIYKYQRLYREGKVSEPLQHLFIISDEFAELKTQQPEFMSQLVSAARIGRSLGVHLILATQKPSGVVDDQIWSNSKFRICLKVQERADSMDMLKRPDAAELTDTGRFYLQVGYNELFEIGQSAWAGAPYYPSDKVVAEKDDSVVVIDTNGRAVRQAKLSKKTSAFGETQKQLDAVVDYLEKISNEENVKARPLWLEPLPEIILLEGLIEKYGVDRSERFVLNPIVGEYDLPEKQSQRLLRIPVSEEGNVVIYGSGGSGKTTFLNTMIYSLLHEHTPEEVNIYIMDFASETLKAFSDAPHVGDVVLSYESEKVMNLLKMLTQQLNRRKKLFVDFGGDYASYTAAGNSIPSIVVVINNFAAFTEIYENDEETVSYLSREGLKYGIYFVLTAISTSSVRFRMLQNFKQLITLQFNDSADYSAVLGKTDGLYPSNFKGRGLVKRGAVYEFQTAHIRSESVPFRFIHDACIKLQQKYKDCSAGKIPILPEVVDAEFLSGYLRNGGLEIPIGVEKNSLNIHYFPFDKSYITQILSTDSTYENFICSITKFIAENLKCKTALIDPSMSFSDMSIENIEYYSNHAEIESYVCELFDTVLERNNTFKSITEKGGTPPEFERMVIVINSISRLKSMLPDENSCKERLLTLLEKGNIKYNIFFVAADSAKGMSSLLYDKWYQQHISQNRGIWIGNGFSEQYVLKANKMTDDMREETADSFGYSVIDGKCIKVKLLSIDDRTDEDYE